MAHFEIQDIMSAFGAEITGFQANSRLDDEERDLLRSTFDERGLLVVRNLDIDRDYQTYLIDLLIGYDRPEGTVSKMVVSNKEPRGLAPYGRLLFHSDMMWAEQPFNVLSLYGLEVAQPAVPTTFVSTKAAWQTLPVDLRARVEGLHAVHVTGQQRRGGYDDDELLDAIRDTEQSVTTLVGHPHPRTGQSILYVSQMNTREIVELPHEESEEVLAALFAHLYSPANTWSHEWRTGDLVVWDNQAIQHARPPVRADGPVRTLRKAISPIPVLTGLAEVPRFANQS